MRRGLKARLSKELDSSKAGKDEPEKYQIRIPGRGTPNKHVKENVIESSNSKKEKEDSVRTASFTMEQEIEIKNNDKKNDDQTPSSSRRRRQINKTEEITETKIENKDENSPSSKNSRRSKKNNKEQIVEKVETVIETKTEVQEPTSKYVRKRKYERGNTPEIKKEEDVKEETSSKYSKKSNKFPKEEKTETVIETVETKIEDNAPNSNRYVRKRKYERGNTPEIKKEDVKEETSSKYSKKSNRLPKEEKTETVVEIETKVENTPGRAKRRKLDESDKKEEPAITPREETSSKYSKKSNRLPKEEKTETVIETVVTKIEKVNEKKEKTPEKNTRRSKNENVNSKEETKKGITENRYENSSKRDKTPPNDRSDSNLDDSRTPTRIKEDIYKKEIGFDDETPNRSGRRQYNKQTNKSKDENTPEKYLKVTPGRYNKQTNDSKKVFDNEGNKTTSRIVGRMGKSPMNTPMVDKDVKEDKSGKDEKFKASQRKTYQSTSTHIRLYGGDFDDIIRTIIHVELNDCRTILTPDLLEIYKNVYFENEDFKNEIFFKVLKNFDDEVGIFDKIKTPHTYNMDMEHLQVLLDSIKTPNEMLNKYIEKAAQIDNSTNTYNN